MSPLFPRADYPRQVFNYVLPDYYEGDSRHGHSRHSHGHSNLAFINPQELMMSSRSPTTLSDDYHSPNSYSSYSSSSRPMVEFRDPRDFVDSSHRRRSSPSPYHHSGSSRPYMVSSGSGSGSGHRHSSSRHSLPTPPMSPSSRNYSRSSSSHHHGPAVAIASGGSSSRHYCHHSSCLDPHGNPTKSFSRRADLQRHHACTHECNGLFSCPRPNCSRKGEKGFSRQDHLIEHRRGYHGEDIPKRGRGSSSKEPRL